MSPTRRITDAQLLRRLIAVGRSFVEELDPETLLDDILAAAQELTGARFAAIGIMNEQRTELARFITRGIDDDAAREIGELPHGRGLLGVLIAEPEPLRLEDLNRHPQSFGFPAGHPPMTSFLGVPIIVRGGAWGNLYLTEKPGGPFDDADEDAVMVLAGWAAVAVNNARLYSTVRERRDELQHVNAVLAATTSITRAMGAETDLARTLELVVKRGRALVSAATMAVALPDGEGLRIVAAAGVGANELRGASLPGHGSTAGRVLADGRPRQLPTGRMGRPPSSLGVPGEDAGHAMLVPLIFRGKPLGVLTALSTDDRAEPFGSDAEELLQAFADSAAAAVATAQSVDEQRLREVLAAAEAERGRWARELHDETLQAMAGIRMQLDHLADTTAGADVVRTGVRRLSATVADEILKLRTLITELRPAALDELGLGPALDTLTARVAAMSGIDVRLQLDVGAHRLDPELETTVYRIVQEGLTNVVKHAGASTCTVIIARGDGHATILLRDDGIGIDPAAVRDRAGFGLTGMRERASLVGGSLDLHPAPGGGTELNARLPLRPNDPH